MADIRTTEVNQAVTALTASLTLLSFPDLRLAFVPMEALVNAVLPIVRHHQTDAIFSFHPQETTFCFDHPDHNITGFVAKFVAAAADVAHFMPESPALPQRPELYLWTTDNRFTHHQPLSETTRKNRAGYLTKHYPSQFQSDKRNEWTTIFDQVTTGDDHQHQERYLKVR